MTFYTSKSPSLYIPPSRRTSSWFTNLENNFISDAILSNQLLNKYDVLQYINSGQLTKQQKYSQIVKGKWANRTTVWATQSSSGYTNPNTQKLMRSITSSNLAISRTTGAILGPTNLPISCNNNPIIDNQVLPTNNNNDNNNNNGTPPPSPVLPPSGVAGGGGDVVPPINPTNPIAPIVIPDNGSLLCNTFEDLCSAIKV